MSEEWSYLDIKPKEKTWCKINEKGELEHLDWDIVEDLARRFDACPPDERTETLLIGKLLVLVRDQVSR